MMNSSTVSMWDINANAVRCHPPQSVSATTYRPQLGQPKAVCGGSVSFLQSTHTHTSTHNHTISSSMQAPLRCLAAHKLARFSAHNSFDAMINYHFDSSPTVTSHANYRQPPTAPPPHPQPYWHITASVIYKSILNCMSACGNPYTYIRVCYTCNSVRV